MTFVGATHDICHLTQTPFLFYAVPKGLRAFGHWGALPHAGARG